MTGANPTVDGLMFHNILVGLIKELGTRVSKLA
jgi:hypothetical protein